MNRIEPVKKCRHHACRCARAEELSRMSDQAQATGLFERAAALAWQAVEVHAQEVRCRQ